MTWQEAQALAAAVIEEVSKLPRSRTLDAIGPQVLRSAGSIPANIAEGYGRYYDAAYRNHLSIARGSLFETETWLDLLHRSGSISDEVNQRVLDQCSEVGKLLTSQMKSLQVKGSSRAREHDSLYVLEEAGD
jgi:four helix bundle protein